MTIDAELLLAEAQSLTANGQTPAVDLGGGALKSKAAYLCAKITIAGAGTGTVQFVVDNDGVDIQAGQAIVANDLEVGDVIRVPIPPEALGSVSGQVVVDGTVSAGVAAMFIELP